MRKTDNEPDEYREVRAVRYLLDAWARRIDWWRPKHGYPSAVPYVDSIKGHIDGYIEGEDYDRIVKAHDLRQVDQAIERDLTRWQRIAIRMTYLNETGPAVWRSNRVPRDEVRKLCEDAELALIAILKRRNVLL